MFGLEKLIVPEVLYGQQSQQRDLDPGKATKRVTFRLYGTVDRTAGANGDQAVRAEGVQRLLEALTLRLDDFRIVDREAGRYLFQLHRLFSNDVVEITPPDAAVVNAGNPSDFEMIFSVHMGPQVELMLPPISPNNGFFAEVEFATGTLNGTSDPGTDALFSAGSDTIEFTTGPNLEIIQETAPKYTEDFHAGRVEPWAIPVVRSWTGESRWSAAAVDLREDFNNRKRFDVLMAAFLDANGVAQNALTTLGVRSSSRIILPDQYPEWALVADAVEQFGDYLGNGTGAGESQGYYPWLAAAGGRLKSRIDPDEHSNLRMNLDVSAPGTGEHHVRFVERALIGWAGKTAWAPK